MTWKSTGEFALTARVVPEIGSENGVLTVISSLKSPGQTAQQLVESRGAYYVLRLKKKSSPDMAKLTDEKKSELRRSEASAFGYAYMNGMEKNLRDELQKRGKIWENPDYMQIDSRKEVADAGDSVPVDVGG